jgi:hypothetical protein
MPIFMPGSVPISQKNNGLLSTRHNHTVLKFTHIAMPSAALSHDSLADLEKRRPPPSPAPNAPQSNSIEQLRVADLESSDRRPEERRRGERGRGARRRMKDGNDIYPVKEESSKKKSRGL